MRTSFTQFLTALRQAQHFLDANANALGTVNTSGARSALDVVAASIASLAETQGTHRIQVRGERTNELRLAAAIRRRYLRPIVRIARAKLPAVAQLSAVTLPPGNGNTTELATAARSMADAVEAYAQVFIDSGMAPEFLDALRGAADQLVQVIGSKGTHRTSRIKATDAIGKEVSQARHAVGVLDALVSAQLDPADPVLTEWRSALRVIQRPAPAKAPDATPPVSTPAPVSTPPAVTDAPVAKEVAPAAHAA